MRSLHLTVYEIFRLAPAPGEAVATGISERSTLVCVLSGEGMVQIGEVETKVGRGTTMLIPSGCDLAIDASSTTADPLIVACANMATHSSLRPSIVDWLDEPLHDHDAATLTLEAFATILDCIARPQMGNMAIVDALLKVVLVEMLRRNLHRQTIDARVLTILTRPEIARVVNCIADDPSANHTADSMAVLAGVPTTELTRRFREMFGLSPIEYVRQARLHKAETLLLETELPVKTIAGMIGFDSRSHFSRLFCRHAGVDPTTFRKRDA